MEFFRDPQINFVGAMKFAFTLSMILILFTLVSVVIHGGPRLSIDFTGGSVLQVRIVDPTPAVGDIRAALENKGYEGVQVTEFGSQDEFLITFVNPQMEETEVAVAEGKDSSSMSISGVETLDATQVLLDDLRSSFTGSGIELRREESVGPKIGGELRTAAVNSVVAALALIVLYITVRFVFRYGVAAIMALVHDVSLTLGVFSLLDLEISLSIIAAFLTIIGYSLNDTIVVFDRIRENMRLRRKESYRQVINRSINECLSRTLLTSLTTFMVSALLFALGGPVIHDFAFALCFGVIVGTYSSMFIASPILVWWNERHLGDRKRTAMDM